MRPSVSGFIGLHRFKADSQDDVLLHDDVAQGVAERMALLRKLERGGGG